MANGFETKQDTITDFLNGMLTRSDTLQAYLNGPVYRQYQKAQIQRWQTQNSSEGDPWLPLTSKYAKRKAKKYAGYPGAGKALMIATGKLSNSAMGRDTNGIMKMVTDRQIKISISRSYVPYAPYAAKLRPVMNFGTDTLASIRQGINDFIKKGVSVSPAIS